jgi:hypothetical protein
MAFGASELRVLRRALALALHPDPASAEDVQDCLRLAESLDEAMREGARLRTFLVADLARYRAALPGTAAGYFTLLQEALGAGYRPDPDDLAALRALRGNPVAAVLLDRCRLLAEQDVRARLAGGQRRPAEPSAARVPAVPACRTRLLALTGGREPLAGRAETPERSERSERSECAERTGEPETPPRKAPAQQPARPPGPPPAQNPGRPPGGRPAEKPERPGRPAPSPAPTPTPTPTPTPAPAPQPSRPVPTPGEVFPRRRPTPPPQGARDAQDAPQRLAAG